MIEAVALIVSLAALVVAAAALYLTSLAPAEIEVDHVRQPDELPSGQFSGPHPQSHELRLAVFISNAGARGGLLEEIRVTDLEWLGEGERYWQGIWRSGPYWQGNRSNPIGMPHPSEAGDVGTAILLADLQPSGGGPEDQARQLAGMGGLAVTIHWTFVRTKGLPVKWPIVPARYRRTRERVERNARVEVSTDEYRSRTIEHWRTYAEFAHLVELAEGTSPA